MREKQRLDQRGNDFWSIFECDKNTRGETKEEQKQRQGFVTQVYEV